MKIENQTLIHAMASNGWSLDIDVFSGLTALDRSVLYAELAKEGRDLEGYKSRLRYLGMVGHEQVLDFGCGFGQWSLALADLNSNVIGVDKAERRITLAQSLSMQTRISGEATFGHSLSEFNLRSGQLDAIFCYSVFMFVPGNQFMAEFARLLRPGGKLYVMVDLPGWHLYRLSRSLKALPSVGYMAFNTLIGRDRNIIYTRRSLEKLITKQGFYLVDKGTDYTTSFISPNFRDDKVDSLILPQRFFGMPMLHEVCAIKI